jgi:allantoicase
VTFTDLPDLATRRLGGAVLAANDESFAEKESLVRHAEPTFTPHTFGHKGQVYDGWETRRRREPGHDWAIVRLGAPGVIRGVVVDTAFFKGNYPPEVSVEGCAVDGYPTVEDLAAATWRTLVPRSPARGDTRNGYGVGDPHRFTHVRLTMHPDGGVARLRVHGEPVADPRLFADLPIDLAALRNGGGIADASDTFFSRADNAISPGDPLSQGDCWETARRRDDGHDWITVRLAGRGVVRAAELDTTHLKYNAPGAARLRGFDAASDRPVDDDAAWFDLLPRTDLRPDTPHRFVLDPVPAATHVRLDIYPDGGMGRLRLFGSLTPEALDALHRRHAELDPNVGAP